MHGLVRGRAAARSTWRASGRCSGCWSSWPRHGAIRSAHDCAEGGFAVALAECCFETGGVGADVAIAVRAVRRRRRSAGRHAVRRVGVARHRQRVARATAARARRGARRPACPPARSAAPAARHSHRGRWRAGRSTARSSKPKRAGRPRWRTGWTGRASVERGPDSGGHGRSRQMMDKFRDECGVFGIFGHTEAANLTYLGLYALQHRGQESVGIATSDGERLQHPQGDGLRRRQLRRGDDRAAGRHERGRPRPLLDGRRERPQERAADPDRLRARRDRRSATTATSSTRRNCATSSSARDRSSRRPATPRCCCTCTRGRRRRPSSRRIVESVSQAQGAFSLVLLTKDRLIAVRDPHGFRPLTLGRLGDAYIVCSETCALDLIDAEWIRDIEPGEVFVVGPEGAKSIHPFPPAPLAHCIFEHVYFARPDSYVFGKSVNEVRTEFGRTARARAAGRRRCRRARFPTRACAPPPAIAEASGMPLQMGLIRNHYVGRTFIEPQQSIRHFGVRVKLNPVRSILAGPARRARRRLDRARHDQPQDRQDGARRRRERSPHADQLSADDLAVLLRRRHAAGGRS